MIEKSPIIFLEDIVKSLQQIEGYIQGLDYIAFSGNQLIVDGVIRNLEIIGEATNHLPDDIKSQVPDVQWVEMVGLRNILIHEYFGIDLEIIWKIITADLPGTKSKIEKLLSVYN